MTFDWKANWVSGTRISNFEDPPPLKLRRAGEDEGPLEALVLTTEAL
jgi:hypothetical protein